jgi:2-methylcitrate synthase
VGKEGTGLTYRGYDVDDLAEKASFEEVAYLLLYGKLPNKEELDAYTQAPERACAACRRPLKEVLERIPASAHPMDVMRTGCSMLGNLEPRRLLDQQQDVADRLLAAFPSIITYWYRYSHDGERIEP